jgi:hypothetical protein
MNPLNSGPLRNANTEGPEETDKECPPILYSTCHREKKEEDTQTGIGQNKEQYTDGLISKPEWSHLQVDYIFDRFVKVKINLDQKLMSF